MFKAELTLKSHTGDKTYDLREDRPLFAGRTVECDVYLPSPAVSRRHAVFLVLGSNCGLKDLESSNGTFLNGQRIAKPMRLKNGDLIQIADFVMEFRIPEGPTYEEASQTVLLGEGARERLRRHEPESAAAPAMVQKSQPDNAAPAAVPQVESPSEPPPIETPALQPVPAVAEERKSHTTSVIREPEAAPQPEPPSDAPLPDEPPTQPDQEQARAAAADTIRKIPKAPQTPRTKAKIDPDEVGDGSGDAQFLNEPEAEEVDGDMVLAKAAAEAGLVGEFVPDVPDTPGGGEPAGQSNGGGETSAPAPAPASQGPTLAVDFPKPLELEPNSIPIDDAFREAIEARLFMYSFLADMRREREELLAANPNMPDAVKSELGRQDREMDKLLTAEQAESMIEKRLARRADLKQKIKDAKSAGLPSPPKPSREMREAEEIAINQWTIMAQSHKEALPAVFAEGYRLNGREPLAGLLDEAGIDGKTLMGGAAYLLALGVLQEETKYNRAFIKAKLSTLAPTEEKKPASGGKRLFGFLSKAKEEEDEEPVEEGESYEELFETERQLGIRVAGLNQECTYIESLLIKEFWSVYVKVALEYLPKRRDMTLAVRAFLRYGAIGFMPWWMKEEVRAHIMEDCTNEVVHHMEVSKSNTNILYADEYLAAVMNMECTPAMDENLEINERNSPNWKADKALRKLINARSQSTLMSELVGTLQGRIDEQEALAAKTDERIANLLPGSKNFKQVKNELSQLRQSYKVETTKLNNLANKIRNETLAILQETIKETEDRFSSGELPKPTEEFLVTRECEAIRKIGRLLANLKERFLPLMLKDNFILGLDSVNDRLAINGEILDLERRDPAMFVETLVPSKKKANRVDLRISPVIVLVPSAGILAFSWNPRQKPEDGRLAIPTCFIRPRLRERQLTYLLSDFRWDTAKSAAGMDVMNSDTIVAAFMTVRWDWRKRSKEGREKGLIFTEQNDRTNWRRVYEAYMQTAMDAGKKLYNRNYDFYERIVGKYFDMPEGVQLLRK